MISPWVVHLHGCIWFSSYFCVSTSYLFFLHSWCASNCFSDWQNLYSTPIRLFPPTNILHWSSPMKWPAIIQAVLVSPLELVLTWVRLTALDPKLFRLQSLSFCLVLQGGWMTVYNRVSWERLIHHHRFFCPCLPIWFKNIYMPTGLICLLCPI